MTLGTPSLWTCHEAVLVALGAFGENLLGAELVIGVNGRKLLSRQLLKCIMRVGWSHRRGRAQSMCESFAWYAWVEFLIRCFLLIPSEV